MATMIKGKSMTGSSRKRKGPAKDSAAVRLAAKRSAKLSAARRKEIARQAALTRWGDKKRAPDGAVVASIEDIAAALTCDIPREDWTRLPSDLIDQLDHYLYGWPRR